MNTGCCAGGATDETRGENGTLMMGLWRRVCEITGAFWATDFDDAPVLDAGSLDDTVEDPDGRLSSDVHA